MLKKLVFSLLILTPPTTLVPFTAGCSRIASTANRASEEGTVSKRPYPTRQNFNVLITKIRKDVITVA
jgi:hypothetical protein